MTSLPQAAWGEVKFQLSYIDHFMKQLIFCRLESWKVPNLKEATCVEKSAYQSYHS